MELKLFTAEENLTIEKINMLLLPFIEFDPITNKKKGVYTALYNYDPATIASIEPTEEGDTIVKAKIGPSYTFAVPTEKFLAYVTAKNRIDLYFLEDIKKQDPNILNVFEKIGVILEYRHD